MNRIERRAPAGSHCSWAIRSSLVSAHPIHILKQTTVVSAHCRRGVGLRESGLKAGHLEVSKKLLVSRRVDRYIAMGFRCQPEIRCIPCRETQIGDIIQLAEARRRASSSGNVGRFTS